MYARQYDKRKQGKTLYYREKKCMHVCMINKSKAEYLYYLKNRHSVHVSRQTM